ncbi:MAG: hypothetical protein AAF078_06015 [Planctomycetota bacterium]
MNGGRLSAEQGAGAAEAAVEVPAEVLAEAGVLLAEADVLLAEAKVLVERMTAEAVARAEAALEGAQRVREVKDGVRVVIGKITPRNGGRRPLRWVPTAA